LPLSPERVICGSAYAARVDVEIEPEPPDGVTEAILSAVAQVDAVADDVSAWWRAGIEQSIADAAAQAGRPRSSPGAARA
jgi:hypothetical protein